MKSDLNAKVFFYKPEPEKIPKLEIIEPIRRDNVIQFDNPNDFNEYYFKNKAEFEGVSTRKLNARYIIPGYIIARRSAGKDKGGDKELKLCKDYYGTSDKNKKVVANNNGEDVSNDKLEDLIEKFNILSDRFEKLLKYLIDSKLIE